MSKGRNRRRRNKAAQRRFSREQPAAWMQFRYTLMCRRFLSNYDMSITFVNVFERQVRHVYPEATFDWAGLDCVVNGVIVCTS